jgi:hypothetical protein
MNESLSSFSSEKVIWVEDGLPVRCVVAKARIPKDQIIHTKSAFVFYEPVFRPTHLNLMSSSVANCSVPISGAIDATTLLALEAFPQQLEAHYAAIPAEYKNWAPTSWQGVPSESFTPIEQICHVRDIEVDGYRVRFHRTLSEECPALASIDGESLAKTRCYANSKGEEVLASFRAERARTVEFLSELSVKQLARTATFEGYGVLSVRSLVHYLCSHDQQHLAGLQWLLGRIEAFRIPTQLAS